MQWYIYLISSAAALFLWKIAAELVAEPIHTAFALRRKTLAQIASFQYMSLPRPRELAVSLHEIRQYDHAVRTLRGAERVFADLGTRFLALSDDHPGVQNLLLACGLDMVRAGRDLLTLSTVYASIKIDSGEARHRINQALQAVDTALKVAPRHSPDALTKIRLEPIYPSSAKPQYR